MALGSLLLDVDHVDSFVFQNWNSIRDTASDGVRFDMVVEQIDDFITWNQGPVEHGVGELEF